MSDFALYIMTAFALVFVIEGLVYAFFPDAIKSMMAMALQLPKEQLRGFGIAMALFGFALIWLLGFLS